MIGGSNAATMLQYALTDQRSALLIQGVQNGSLNADEFRELQMMVNQQAQDAGNSPPVTLAGGAVGQALQDQARAQESYQEASQAQAEFDRLYQEYTHGDYHPVTYPKDGVGSRQIQQLDSLYEGLRDGSVTSGEARQVLSTQRSASFELGRAGSDGTVSQQERAGVHGRLNQAAAELN
ncbi:MAG: hypothetical protein AB1758_24960, partial [Candidatus Eremiobacterota bacterium]